MEEIELPLELDTEEFRQALGEWIAHKKEKRSHVTPLSAKKLLNELRLIGSSRAVAAINHSIAMGWQGVHVTSQNSQPQQRKDIAV